MDQENKNDSDSGAGALVTPAPKIDQALADAQRQKLLLETKEIEKRLSQTWHSPRLLLQGMIGGIIASALVAGWIVGYLQPTLRNAELDNKRINLESQIQQNINELKRQELERRAKAMAVENETFRKQLGTLAVQNKSLQKQQSETELRAELLVEKLEKIEKDYRELAETQATTEKERAQYVSLAETTQNEVSTLRKQIKLSAEQRAETTEQGKILESEIAADRLRDTYWKIECVSCSNNFAIYLRSDNIIGRTQVNMLDNIDYTSQETWKVSGDKLILNWKTEKDEFKLGEQLSSSYVEIQGQSDDSTVMKRILREAR